MTTRTPPPFSVIAQHTRHGGDCGCTSAEFIPWSEVKEGDQVLWDGKLRTVRQAGMELHAGRYEYMRLKNDEGGEHLFAAAELTAVRRCACRETEDRAA